MSRGWDARRARPPSTRAWFVCSTIRLATSAYAGLTGAAGDGEAGPRDRCKEAVALERADAGLVEGAPGEGLVAGGVDALPQPQAHEEELVGLGLGGEDLLGDEAVALRFDPLHPGLRMAFRRGGEAALRGRLSRN